MQLSSSPANSSPNSGTSSSCDCWLRPCQAWSLPKAASWSSLISLHRTLATITCDEWGWQQAAQAGSQSLDVHLAMHGQAKKVGYNRWRAA
jgi:hypothetical protein